jgi:hypothetical protein
MDILKSMCCTLSYSNQPIAFNRGIILLGRFPAISPGGEDEADVIVRGPLGSRAVPPGSAAVAA